MADLLHTSAWHEENVPVVATVEKPHRGRFFATALYVLMGVTASFAMFLLLYAALLFNATITTLVTNTYANSWYFWPYVVLTFGAIVLFGVYVGLSVRYSRRYGRRSKKGQVSAGAGVVVGILASACVACGSTILSTLGIANGLAAFPFKGLELKLLSFVLMVASLWFMYRDGKRMEREGSTVLPRHEASFTGKEAVALGILALTFVYFPFLTWRLLRTEPIVANAFTKDYSVSANTKLLDEVKAAVLPDAGYQSRIQLGDSISKLVERGVIDRSKFDALYQSRGGLPQEIQAVFNGSSTSPILLTKDNANYYLDLLWPLGLANHMASNKDSPISGKSLFGFASTAGWSLGSEANGGAYFNKFQIVPLTTEQEALVRKVAENSYRPCCNNSTFFQDCNHGSALLGLLELGVSQGLSEDDLYREALAFNSFWFPNNYVETAVYFKAVRHIDWKNVDPRLVLSKDFSSLSGWSGTVDQAVRKLGLLPVNASGPGCSI